MGRLAILNCWRVYQETEVLNKQTVKRQLFFSTTELTQNAMNGDAFQDPTSHIRGSNFVASWWISPAAYLYIQVESSYLDRLHHNILVSNGLIYFWLVNTYGYLR
jgi:hypothetical protein